MTALDSSLADLADLAHMDGCTVLDGVADFLARFIAYPSEHARYAHALWLAHTWRMDKWESTPRLAFMSPEKGSGKTRALEVSEHLVPRAVRVSQATTGYVLAKVSQDPPPTLFYDEIDTVYGQKARGNEDLRAVLNAGHRRGATAGRGLWGPDGLTGQDYAAYCAVALAGLGGLPDTIADRAVVISMKKRKHTERVEQWRGRLHGDEAKELGERLAELEKGLGASLFHRSTRKLSLTEDGSAFLEKALKKQGMTILTSTGVDKLERSVPNVPVMRGEPVRIAHVGLPHFEEAAALREQ